MENFLISKFIQADSKAKRVQQIVQCVEDRFGIREPVTILKIETEHLEVRRCSRYGNPTNLDFTAAFAGAPDANFKVKGIGLQRHTGWIGLGATSQVGTDLSWFVNYDMQLGRGGVNNNVFSAGLRYAFN